MYKIKDYSFIQAKKLAVTIKPSKKKGKKLDVYNKKGELISSIGAIEYMDYPSYLEKRGYEYAKERKRLYRIRHAGEEKNVGSNGYYAYYILW